VRRLHACSVIFACVLLACVGPTDVTPPHHGSQTPASALAALAAEYWDHHLETHPIEATVLGDRRFDDRVPDVTPPARARDATWLEAMRARVRGVDPAALAAPDRVTRAALLGELENDLAWNACALEEWSADPMDGPQVALQNLGELQPVATVAQAHAMVARWQRLGGLIDEIAANHRRSLTAGKVSPRRVLERVIGQLDSLLATPDPGWAILRPIAVAHTDWPNAEQAWFRAELPRAVATSIRPAFQRFRDLLANESLPRARDGEHVGLAAVPGGRECYAKLIQVHTSLPASADELHRFGVEEVARVREQMRTLGQTVLRTNDLAEIQRRLRTDPALFFSSAQQIEDKARAALGRAQAAMPRWFGTLPRVTCVVKRVEPYEEKDTTIAYYREPAIDGSRAGTYYVNTYAPTTRPLYEAEVLAFHESVPGHHTQIALAAELGGVPEFRKHAGVTAFVEGWALYTERLADEMGLYSGDLDRMGMLSFDAWRASRLVVDTGMHAMGWGRQRAVDYMLENTALTPNNIDNEVDRYIATPAQALAYKVGQREILRLRAEAERRLARRFDIRAFHDVLLQNGGLSLPVLRAEVEAWIERVERDGAHRGS